MCVEFEECFFSWCDLLVMVFDFLVVIFFWVCLVSVLFWFSWCMCECFGLLVELL